jgi:hypothetical protein
MLRATTENQSKRSIVLWTKRSPNQFLKLKKTPKSYWQASKSQCRNLSSVLLPEKTTSPQEGKLVTIGTSQPASTSNTRRSRQRISTSGIRAGDSIIINLIRRKMWDACRWKIKHTKHSGMKIKRGWICTPQGTNRRLMTERLGWLLMSLSHFLSDSNET